MNPVLSWTERLKRYRKQKAEDYAKTIMATPDKVPLYRAMRFPGVDIIMGDIRSGKTALAHEIAHQFNVRRGLPATLYLPTVPREIQRKLKLLLPDWMTISTTRAQWATNSIVIYDEAAQSAHSRRSQSEEALELDDLLSISGQRNQLILFISHFGRKLDLNVCTAVHRIIWKRPTYAHQLWERNELTDFTARAYDFFHEIKGEIAQKKASLILDLDNFGFSQATNSLPPWWSDELSRIFKDISLQKKSMGDIVRG